MLNPIHHKVTTSDYFDIIKIAFNFSFIIIFTEYFNTGSTLSDSLDDIDYEDSIQIPGEDDQGKL